MIFLDFWRNELKWFFITEVLRDLRAFPLEVSRRLSHAITESLNTSLRLFISIFSFDCLVFLIHVFYVSIYV